MLHEIDIDSYAVIEQLRVRFEPGLNLLTGETGSGKSIVVDALSLLLGARATSDVIRPGSGRARIAGVFEVEPHPEWERLTSDGGFGDSGGEWIIEREILAGGKSRAYVNGRVVTLSLLREMAPWLADIHGQHEQQNLFSPRAQLEMLDAYAGTLEERETLAQAYRRWRELGRRIDELRGDEQERLRLLDLYRFQHREIAEARLQPGEEDELERERRTLSNLTRIEEAGAAAYDALYDSSVSAAAQIKSAAQALQTLAGFDDSFRATVETLEGARATIEDAAFELRGYLDKLEADPSRLDEIEGRLALIERLKRKYGKSLSEVIAYGAEAAARVEELESGEQTAAELEKQQAAAAERYRELAGMLSKRRREAAATLEKQVEKELAALAMEKARFRLRFEPPVSEPAEWQAHGIDRMAFLVSANPGQPPRPLAQVASGGELSRITLALKTCLTARSPAANTAAATGAPRTLVFDEIDTGVGGRVADALGRRLKRLSESHQLLCVTHLPQIAGFADAHFYVEKVERNNRTFAAVQRLSEQQRIEELARMLSGEKITPAAMQNAKQILRATQGANR